MPSTVSSHATGGFAHRTVLNPSEKISDRTLGSLQFTDGPTASNTSVHSDITTNQAHVCNRRSNDQSSVERLTQQNIANESVTIQPGVSGDYTPHFVNEFTYAQGNGYPHTGNSICCNSLDANFRHQYTQQRSAGSDNFTRRVSTPMNFEQAVLKQYNEDTLFPMDSNKTSNLSEQLEETSVKTSIESEDNCNSEVMNENLTSDDIPDLHSTAIHSDSESEDTTPVPSVLPRIFFKF